MLLLQNSFDYSNCHIFNACICLFAPAIRIALFKISKLLELPAIAASLFIQNASSPCDFSRLMLKLASRKTTYSLTAPASKILLLPLNFCCIVIFMHW
jgi:hypothetical protein